MEKIRIVTESASDYVKPFPENLTVLPLTIRFGQEEFHDGVDIDHKMFFEKLISGKELPSTSLIPPGEFEAVYDKAEAAGETVIAIILSSKLSGTYQSAVLAADGRENVYVVDSLNATLGEQILVKYALQLAEQGMPAAELVAEIERAKTTVNLMGLPDTLDYLHRGGRISKTVALLGGALNIKPVLRLVDGVVIMVGKARGSRNGNKYLVEEAKKNGIDFSKPFCLGYTGLEDTLLQKFITDAAELWEGRENLPVSTVGATIGTHVGPDAVVLAFFGKQ